MAQRFLTPVTSIVFADLTDTTKKVQVDVSNVTTGNTVLVNLGKGTINSTTVQSNTGVANSWVSAIDGAGVITMTQPNFNNLAGNWALAQGPTSTAGIVLGRTDTGTGVPQELTQAGLYVKGTVLNNKVLSNADTASLAVLAADTYLPGSLITVAAGDFTAGTVYHIVLHMSKTAAGTAWGPYNFRMGTAGSVSDTLIMALTAAQTGTAAVDTAVIETWVTFRTVGASATLAWINVFQHNVASGGLFTAAQLTIGSISTVSAVNTTTPTKIGVSYKGDASPGHTCTVLKAQLIRP